MCGRQVQRGNRTELGWMLAGFVAVQAALAVGIDRFWPAVRDPEYSRLARLLHDRRAERPNQPLVLALGSSRTESGLEADRLGRNEGALVFNFGIPASGPMMQRIALERLLAAGVRPDLILLEVMPMSYSQRVGEPLEERQLDPARLYCKEMLTLARYFNRRELLFRRWACAHILPVYRHQTELRETLRLDLPAGVRLAPGAIPGRDCFGWNRRAIATNEEVLAGERIATGNYESAFWDFRLVHGPKDAFADLLALCRKEYLKVAMVIPPEGTLFQEKYALGNNEIDDWIKKVAAEFGAMLVDARLWIDDTGFRDGHHLCCDGAVQFTDRLGREALRPLIQELVSARNPKAVAQNDRRAR